MAGAISEPPPGTSAPASVGETGTGSRNRDASLRRTRTEHSPGPPEEGTMTPRTSPRRVSPADSPELTADQMLDRLMAELAQNSPAPRNEQERRAAANQQLLNVGLEPMGNPALGDLVDDLPAITGDALALPGETGPITSSGGSGAVSDPPTSWTQVSAVQGAASSVAPSVNLLLRDLPSPSHAEAMRIRQLEELLDVERRRVHAEVEANRALQQSLESQVRANAEFTERVRALETEDYGNTVRILELDRLLEQAVAHENQAEIAIVNECKAHFENMEQRMQRLRDEETRNANRLPSELSQASQGAQTALQAVSAEEQVAREAVARLRSSVMEQQLSEAHANDLRGEVQALAYRDEAQQAEALAQGLGLRAEALENDSANTEEIMDEARQARDRVAQLELALHQEVPKLRQGVLEQQREGLRDQRTVVELLEKHRHQARELEVEKLKALHWQRQAASGSQATLQSTPAQPAIAAPPTTPIPPAVPPLSPPGLSVGVSLSQAPIPKQPGLGPSPGPANYFIGDSSSAPRSASNAEAAAHQATLSEMYQPAASSSQLLGPCCFVCRTQWPCAKTAVPCGTAHLQVYKHRY